MIPDYIKNLNLHEKIKFTTICMKDSRHINTIDRKKMIRLIEKSPDSLFIITHGTYTMPDSSRFLEANLKRKGVVIIFTGSMISLSFPGSDGGFNLGYSLANISHASPGVYVSMNGRLFKPKEVEKLLSEGRFASIFQT